ncbi:hypothetical protein [Aliagarivorans marinus]|uniref:hypothetical protein n=1 Tax=Aliagarivorans marinus TaxID=561965 RepID=UPI000410A6F6
MLNHYENALYNFVEEKKKLEFPFFSRNDGSKTNANWLQNFFFYESKNKKRQSISIYNRYLYPNEMVKNAEQFANLSNKCKFLLSSYYADICKALTIQIEKDRKKKGYQFVPKEHCHYFQKWLGWMQEKSLKIHEYTPSKHSKFMSWLMDRSLKPGSEYAEETKILGAIRTLQSIGAIDENIKFKQVASLSSERTTQEVVRRKSKKMPSNDDIAVALTIFHKVMPSEKDKIDIFDNTRNRFVASSYMMSLAATQRFAAENPYLNTHALSSRESSNGQEVFCFTFPGSKGFKINNKHVHGPLIPFVEKSLNFLVQAGNPARALARFYENPQLSASEVMFGIEVEDWKEVDKSKPLDLWKIAHLLGLFDNVSKEVTDELKNVKGYPLNINPKTKIQSMAQASALIGVAPGNYNRQERRKIVQSATVGDLQDEWIAHIKRNLPNFPYRIHSNENKVLLKDALTIFTGNQLNSKGSWVMSTSPFAIDTTDYGDVFRGAISASGKGNLGRYFTENGFSAEEYGVAPHMIRHYSNTIYQESGVSDEHIAIASGRVSVKSNADYDHLTVDEIAFRASRHLNGKDEFSHIEGNVITAEEYCKLTNRSASDTGVGICTQDLSESPCTHLSDFKYHCVDCTKAAFCKGSKRAIEAMKTDIEQQRNRLEMILNRGNLHKSELSRAQFIQKVENLGFYKELLKLMTSKEIPDGTLIRFTGLNKKTVGFQLYDIVNRKSLNGISIDLPNYQKQLDDKITELFNSEKRTESKLSDFLSANGISI